MASSSAGEPMNEDQGHILIQISQQLGEIFGEMKSVLGQLARHEERLTRLESVKSDAVCIQAKDSFKDELLKTLAKCLLVSITAIGSLVGAAPIIA